jgi:hypothetical protein
MHVQASTPAGGQQLFTLAAVKAAVEAAVEGAEEEYEARENLLRNQIMDRMVKVERWVRATFEGKLAKLQADSQDRERALHARFAERESAVIKDYTEREHMLKAQFAEKEQAMMSDFTVKEHELTAHFAGKEQPRMKDFTVKEHELKTHFAEKERVLRAELSAAKMASATEMQDALTQVYCTHSGMLTGTCPPSEDVPIVVDSSMYSYRLVTCDVGTQVCLNISVLPYADTQLACVAPAPQTSSMQPHATTCAIDYASPRGHAQLSRLSAPEDTTTPQTRRPQHLPASC